MFPPLRCPQFHGRSCVLRRPHRPFEPCSLDRRHLEVLTEGEPQQCLVMQRAKRPGSDATVRRSEAGGTQMTAVASRAGRLRQWQGTGALSSNYYFEIFPGQRLGLLLEISYTRIISFKLFYYYVSGHRADSCSASVGGVLVAIPAGRLARLDRLDPAVVPAPGCRVVADSVLSSSPSRRSTPSPSGTTARTRSPTGRSCSGSASSCSCRFSLPGSFCPRCSVGGLKGSVGSTSPTSFGAAIACAIAVPLMASAGPRPRSCWRVLLPGDRGGVDRACRRMPWFLVVAVLGVLLFLGMTARRAQALT